MSTPKTSRDSNMGFEAAIPDPSSFTMDDAYTTADGYLQEHPFADRNSLAKILHLVHLAAFYTGCERGVRIGRAWAKENELNGR